MHVLYQAKVKTIEEQKKRKGAKLRKWTIKDLNMQVGLDRLCSQNHEKLLFLKPKSC